MPKVQKPANVETPNVEVIPVKDAKWIPSYCCYAQFDTMEEATGLAAGDVVPVKKRVPDTDPVKYTVHNETVAFIVSSGNGKEGPFVKFIAAPDPNYTKPSKKTGSAARQTQSDVAELKASNERLERLVTVQTSLVSEFMKAQTAKK